MREIMFRGKSIHEEKEEWFYGQYSSLPEPNIMYINSKNEFDCEPVKIETVGQFTGFYDKSKYPIPIYEGDILKSPSSYDKVFWYKSGWGTKVMKRHKIEGGWVIGFTSNQFSVHAKYGEVVGNIYDNPELISNKYSTS